MPAPTSRYSRPFVTAHARREPGVPAAMRTQRGPWVLVPSGRGRLRRSGPPRPGTGSAGWERQGRFLVPLGVLTVHRGEDEPWAPAKLLSRYGARWSHRMYER